MAANLNAEFGNDAQGDLAPKVVEQLNGSWGYWDETWSSFTDGFNSHAEATAACASYAKQL